MVNIVLIFQKIFVKSFYILEVFKWRFQTKSLYFRQVNHNRKRILICDLAPMLVTAKTQALIAGEMSEQGLDVTLLISGKNSVIEAIYRAVLPEIQIIYLDQLEIDKVFIKKTAEILIGAANSDLQTFTKKIFQGFYVGKNSVSAAVRKLRVGQLSVEDRDHMDVLKESILSSVRGMEISKFVKEVFFDYALFNEKGYSPNGEICDALIGEGTDVIQWVAAPLDGSLVFKRYSVENRNDHQLAIGKQTWAELKKVRKPGLNEKQIKEKIGWMYRTGKAYNRQELQKDKVFFDKDKLQQILKLDKDKPTAVIFAHIFYDATFFYGESLFSNYEEWLVETVRRAVANVNLNWIVKVHPVNIWRSKLDGKPMEQLEAEAIKKAIGDLPGHVQVLSADTIANTFSLFQVTDYGLTVRGTIGSELPCFGIPVVVAGTGRYSNRGFTINPKTKAEYFELIDGLHLTPKLNKSAVKDACLHYEYSILRQPMHLRSFRQMFEASNWLSQANVKLSSASKFRELKAQDLEPLVSWIINETTAEYFGNGDLVG